MGVLRTTGGELVFEEAGFGKTHIANRYLMTAPKEIKFVNFSGCTIRRRSVTEDTTFSNCQFEKATIKGTFVRCTFKDCGFAYANLWNSKFRNVTFEGCFGLVTANMARVTYDGVCFKDTSINPFQLFDGNFSLVKNKRLLKEFARWDCSLFPNYNKFNSWAKGEGDCPFSDFKFCRPFDFNESNIRWSTVDGYKTNWKPEKPKMTFGQLVNAVCKECNITFERS